MRKQAEDCNFSSEKTLLRSPVGETLSLPGNEPSPRRRARQRQTMHERRRRRRSISCRHSIKPESGPTFSYMILLILLNSSASPTSFLFFQPQYVLPTLLSLPHVCATCFESRKLICSIPSQILPNIKHSPDYKYHLFPITSAASCVKKWPSLRTTKSAYVPVFLMAARVPDSFLVSSTVLHFSMLCCEKR